MMSTEMSTILVEGVTVVRLPRSGSRKKKNTGKVGRVIELGIRIFAILAFEAGIGPDAWNFLHFLYQPERKKLSLNIQVLHRYK